uniref:hypothetical protein n=2 Tax=Bacillus TaxID=1386 RepID=UPI00202BA30E|nr:hypothetical protein [Bacillus thuringiensis]
MFQGEFKLFTSEKTLNFFIKTTRGIQMEKIINALKEAANESGLKGKEVNLHNVLSECLVKGDMPEELYKQIEEYVKKTA